MFSGAGRPPLAAAAAVTGGKGVPHVKVVGPVMKQKWLMTDEELGALCEHLMAGCELMVGAIGKTA